MNARQRRYCFTLNNPTDAHRVGLSAIECVYIVYGEEIAPTTGTPHLQGFVCFTNGRSIVGIVAEIGGGHWEPARGTSKQAATYCKKDGNFIERGALPDQHGRRTDIDEIIQWLDDFITDNGRAPSAREVAKLQPKAMLRYRNFMELCRLKAPVVIRQGEPRPWQLDLSTELLGEADDRSILFYVDEDGGKGKTWFQQWFLSNNPDITQMIGVGRREDMAFAIDPDKSVFFINVPRDGMQFLQYSVLEMLKDRMVFSTKYTSEMKILSKNAHVVVFCNEQLDPTKMSADRPILRGID